MITQPANPPLSDEEKIDKIIQMQEEIDQAFMNNDMERIQLAHNIMCNTKYPYLYAAELMHALVNLLPYAEEAVARMTEASNPTSRNFVQVRVAQSKIKLAHQTIQLAKGGA